MVGKTVKPTAVQRLVKFIDKRGDDECWPWIGGMGSWGYGSFWLEDHNINAHRAAYLLLVGPIADDLVVCHRCDNPPCCNPRHLFPGTVGDNIHDCYAKGRGRGNFSERRGLAHPRYFAVLDDSSVREVRRLYFEQRVSQTELGRRYGMSSSAISRAVRGLTWAHVK